MLTKIQVTQEHIDNGFCLSPSQCAVALAISSVCKLNENLRFTVAQSNINFIEGIDADDEIRQVIATPPEVSDFITRFDRKQPVEPFEFEIDIPKQYLKES